MQPREILRERILVMAELRDRRRLQQSIAKMSRTLHLRIVLTKLYRGPICTRKLELVLRNDMICDDLGRITFWIDGNFKTASAA